MLALAAASPAEAGPAQTRIVRAPGKIVPIPRDIPHEAGDTIDHRLIPNLRYIARRWPIYITDGRAGAPHAIDGEHPLGLAVDIVPLGGTTRCDRKWRPITSLARWAEPRQNIPVAPFRWVGYDGDAAHGCGHHLHLSWDHAAARPFGIAPWVKVFALGGDNAVAGTKDSGAKKRPNHGSGGLGALNNGGTGAPRG